MNKVIEEVIDGVNHKAGFNRYQMWLILGVKENSGWQTGVKSLQTADWKESDN